MISISNACKQYFAIFVLLALFWHSSTSSSILFSYLLFMPVISFNNIIFFYKMRVHATRWREWSKLPSNLNLSKFRLIAYTVVLIFFIHKLLRGQLSERQRLLWTILYLEIHTSQHGKVRIVHTVIYLFFNYWQLRPSESSLLCNNYIFVLRIKARAVLYAKIIISTKYKLNTALKAQTICISRMWYAVKKYAPSGGRER